MLSLVFVFRYHQHQYYCQHYYSCYYDYENLPRLNKAGYSEGPQTPMLTFNPEP